jgi:hypothetical protein
MVAAKELGKHMANERLDDQSTISSLRDELENPVSYTREVLQRLWDCERGYGASHVRVGLTTGGGSPHYVIEPIAPPAPGNPRIVATYNGRTHRALSKKDSDVVNQWAKAALTLPEVSLLIGELRHYKPAGAPLTASAARAARKAR